MINNKNKEIVRKLEELFLIIANIMRVNSIPVTSYISNLTTYPKERKLTFTYGGVKYALKLTREMK